MNPVVILLRPSAKFKKLKVINDAVPGAILLFAGLESLMSGGFRPGIMTVINILLGGAVIRFAIAEMRSHPAHSKINWFDTLAGVVIVLNAHDIYKPYKGFQPAHLLLLAGILTIVRGILAERLPTRRRIVIEREYLLIRTSPFRRVKIPWTDLHEVAARGETIDFTLRKGSASVSLKRFENAQEGVSAILDSAKERNISVGSNG